MVAMILARFIRYPCRIFVLTFHLQTHASFASILNEEKSPFIIRWGWKWGRSGVALRGQ